MSTEVLEHGDNASYFLWQDFLDKNDYVSVTYVIETLIDPEVAAIGMAKEQSASATRVSTTDFKQQLEHHTARVLAVEPLEKCDPSRVEPYFLNTSVYDHKTVSSTRNRARIKIAFPLIIFESGLVRMWNVIFGELSRLGFITGISITDIQPPSALLQQFDGPRYGLDGIRNSLGIAKRPIFCRSARPAVGLSTKNMLDMSSEVLSGGFDIIKDDELTFDTQTSPLKDRIRRMVEMKQRVEDRTGEKKWYLVNVIDDYSKSLEKAHIAAELGADGVLVSPHTQGLSIISDVRRQTELAVLSHNTGGDILTRHPFWGVRDPVMAMLQRMAGADMLITPGPFASSFGTEDHQDEFIRSCTGALGNIRPSLPIIQGGKFPQELTAYIDAVGSCDFMIIAATWLDNHPDGLFAGAAAFRDAWRALNAG